ncbi:hypothetical protein Ndes2526B_g02535 [Nannochloris sp. 'desiccata']
MKQRVSEAVKWAQHGLCWGAVSASWQNASSLRGKFKWGLSTSPSFSILSSILYNFTRLKYTALRNTNTGLIAQK